VGLLCKTLRHCGLKRTLTGGHFVLRWVAILGEKVRGFSRGLDRSVWGKKAENPLLKLRS